MKYLLIATMFLLGTQVFAQKKQAALPAKPKLAAGQVAVLLDEKYEIYTFKEKNSVQLSDACFDPKAKKPCEAQVAADHKFAIPPAKHPDLQHPAVQYCRAMGGRPMIGQEVSGNDTDICVFPDKSAVKSWGALYKHYPKQVIQ